MDDQESKSPRRVRYKGTHPKSFKEKYKELQPDKYIEDIEKVILQGRTPAGMHLPICVKEIMEFLSIVPSQKGLDATLGYGGHSVEMLKYLAPGGQLFAIDVDPYEITRTQDRLLKLGFGPEKIVIKKMNFAEIDQIISETGPLNFVIADLGVSSMQIDNPDRGFSVKMEGPLDMRLNPKKGISATTLLKSISQNKLEEILTSNADEPYATEIANAITTNLLKGKVINTTTELKGIIHQALHFLPKNMQTETFKKSTQRCFQALRIEVNNEFAVLDKFLEKLPSSLAKGGRVAILSFHSGEDRRVKKSFQSLFREGVYHEIAAEPIRPSLAEININPRASSAKLRWAIKA